MNLDHKAVRALQIAAQQQTTRKRKQTKVLPEQEETIEDNVPNEDANMENENASVVEFDIGYSRKGKDGVKNAVLWHSSVFRFIKKEELPKKNQIKWECDHRRKWGCPVYALTSKDDITRGRIYPSAELEEHEHVGKVHGLEVEQKVAEFKNRVKNEPTTDAGKIATEILDIPEENGELFALMPTHKALTEAAARTRRAAGTVINCNDLSKVQIGPEFAMKNGHPFLVYDSGPGRKDRVMMFASNQALQYLKTNHHWSADATFSVCPKVFYQLLVIGFFIEHAAFPCVYALMPSKKKPYYLETLQALKELLGDGNEPESILTDFENAEFNSFAEIFPTTEVKACLFHLAQAHITYLKKMGLIKRYYNKDGDVRKTVRWCTALAFLPKNLVRKGFEFIINQSPAGLEKFLYYVAKTYIGLSKWEYDEKKNAFKADSDTQRLMMNIDHSTLVSLPVQPRLDNSAVRSLQLSATLPLTDVSNTLTLEDDNEKELNSTSMDEEPELGHSDQFQTRHQLPEFKKPLFPISLWNMRERVENDLPRSQASMEANHLGMQMKSRKRPIMSKFIKTLYAHDTDKMVKIRDALTKKLPRRRLENIEMDRQIKQYIKNFPLTNDGQIPVFLQAISCSLQHMEPKKEKNEDFIDSDDSDNEEEIDETEPGPSNQNIKKQGHNMVKGIPLSNDGLFQKPRNPAKKKIAKQIQELADTSDSNLETASLNDGSISDLMDSSFNSIDEFENGVNQDNIYIAEKIAKERTKNGRKEYLVKWCGYSKKECTWEPRQNIFDPVLLTNFEKTKNKKAHKK